MKTKWFYPIVAFVFLFVYFFIWTKGAPFIEILIATFIITLLITFISLWKSRKK